MSVTSILTSAGVFATTIQAQDFKDTEGDKAVGRTTLPIVAPRSSRPILMVLLLIWAIGLTKVWNLDTIASATFVLLALTVGVRFMFLTSIKADQRSYYLYNVRFYHSHLPARPIINCHHRSFGSLPSICCLHIAELYQLIEQAL